MMAPVTPYAFDPQLAEIIPAIPDIDARDVTTARSTLREMIAALPAPDTAGVTVEHCVVAATAGGADLRLRLYHPEPPSAPAAIYTIHGGGFFMGDLDTDHARNVVLARDLGILVVSVDYRLAPETPYPGGLQDVYTGFAWLAAHAAELGVDPARIALRGASAGGGLAAGLALLARDRGGPDVAFQFLAIPELDDRLDTPSARRFTDTPNWRRRNSVASWHHYLGERAGGEDVPAYAAPARATQLRGLPPTYLAVAQYDPFRDEGAAYAHALLAADVPVELHLFPGTFHGSSTFDTADVSRRELDEELTVLRRALLDHPRPTTPDQPTDTEDDRIHA